MNVLICTPVLRVGGTEMHIRSLVQALRPTGCQIGVLCYYQDVSPFMVEAIELAGSKVSILELSRSEGLAKLFVKLRSEFKRIRPDVVHVQYIAPGLVPLAAARAAGIGTVFATVHQLGDRFGFRERALFRLAARLCTAFFSVSRAVEESWFGDSAFFDGTLATRGRKHFTIYNGIRVPRNRCSPEDLKHKLGLSGQRVIGIVGRLSKEKGHAFVLDALPYVVAEVPETVLLIVGDGSERKALVEQAKRLGMGRRVMWAGERTGSDVQELYQAMDVVAVPSAFEGFGLVAAEAMAAGRPVVATKVGGLKEVIADGETGVLVYPGDTASLARALIGILHDSKQAEEMGTKGQERALERFSSDRFTESISEAYRYFCEQPQ